LEKNSVKSITYEWITEKKEYEGIVKLLTTGAVIFQDEDGGVYLDHVFRWT